jgi:hypothetical protein
MAKVKRRTVLEGVARWALPLLLTAAAVVAVFLFFRHIDISRSENGLILVVAGGAYLVASAFVLGFTRRWELRSLGQVVSYLADGCLYLLLGLGLMRRHGPLTRDEQNWIRAGFVVGGPLLVAGLVLYALRLWRDERGPRRRPEPAIVIAPEP